MIFFMFNCNMIFLLIYAAPGGHKKIIGILFQLTYMSWCLMAIFSIRRILLG